MYLNIFIFWICGFLMGFFMNFVSIIFGFELIFIEWDWLFFILVFGLFGDCLLMLIVVVVVEILCLGFFFGWYGWWLFWIIFIGVGVKFLVYILFFFWVSMGGLYKILIFDLLLLIWCVMLVFIVSGW